MNNEMVIETDSLSKTFQGKPAVNNLSMQVRRGHVYGLLGPNGSGKTTTMGMLLGLLRPTSGSFRLFGTEGPQSESLRRIGAVIESPALYPYLTGRENLAYFQKISGRGSPRDPDRLLDQVGWCCLTSNYG